MQATTKLLTALCAAVVCQLALADEPQSPSPAQTAAGPAEQPTGGEKSAATPAAGQNAAAAPAAGSPSVKTGLTVVSAKPELTPDDKELIARGYKLEMRHGEKYFCRTEGELGSRFERKSCNTAESIAAHRASGQEALRTIQSDRAQANH